METYWGLYIAWSFGFLMLSTTLLAPFLKRKYGFLLGIILYALVDITMSRVGIWTLTSAFAWGLAGWWMATRQPSGSFKTFLGMSVAGTLLFDFVSGPIFGSWLWRMPFEVALIGQIPFTMSHLIGNVVVTGIFAPIIYPLIAGNKQFASFISKYKIAKPTAFKQEA
ncbi:MAG: hypothetical protein V1834_01635 [Candidatus Micrarchaeota archaeon]